MLEIDITNIEDEILMKVLIDSLSERDKTIITMARDGYEYSEIAKELELTEQRIGQIIKKFKEDWEKG
jgi:DNA-directed RNA polymerase specialized sigma subunit